MFKYLCCLVTSYSQSGSDCKDKSYKKLANKKSQTVGCKTTPVYVKKKDLITMFQELFSGDLPSFSMNFGVITLIPKSEDANTIQLYCPICLLNVSFKIFTESGMMIYERG
jgi:hypothetical protein